jgi:hypothetical protein
MCPHEWTVTLDSRGSAARRKSMPPSRGRILYWVPAAGSCPVFRSVGTQVMLPRSGSAPIVKGIFDADGDFAH